MACIFCKIIAGEIPSQKVYEDELVLAFRDIHPAAPVHVLVVPKQHIENLQAVTNADDALIAHTHRVIRKVAELEGIADGYRVVVNCGAGAGQTVMHLHYHVLGGRVFGEKIL